MIIVCFGKTCTPSFFLQRNIIQITIWLFTESCGIFAIITTNVFLFSICLFVFQLIFHLTCLLFISARPQDFFDVQTMDAIRHRAVCLNLATHIESGGNGHSVVFHSTVCGLILYVLQLLYICVFKRLKLKWKQT